MKLSASYGFWYYKNGLEIPYKYTTYVTYLPYSPHLPYLPYLPYSPYSPYLPYVPRTPTPPTRPYRLGLSLGGRRGKKINLSQGEPTTIMIRVPEGRAIVAMFLAVVCRRRSRELERKMNTTVSSCSLPTSAAAEAAS